MATITFNDQGNAVDGEVRFVFGATNFTLKPGESYETEDPLVIREAVNHTYLHVEVPEDETAQAEIAAVSKSITESTDPNVNLHADHLSPVADPAVVEAAQKQAEHDRLVAAGKDPNAAPEAEESPAGVQDQPADDAPPAPTAPSNAETQSPDTSTQETHE